MGRLGIDPGRIEALFLTHLHGDHILGLPPYLLHRAFLGANGPFRIVGPRGVAEHLERLFELSWHGEWPNFRDRARLEYDEGRERGEVAGVEYETVGLKHGDTPARGYRLRIDGRLLAYAGDTQATSELEELVRDADVAITEATAPGAAGVHTSWEQAQELATRHPRTRFFFNHVFQGDPSGAVQDLEVVEV
jgi:ribonuclease Z